MNEEIIKKLFPEKFKRIKEGKCPICGEPINMKDFKDPKSIVEFRISKMCQKCQDDIFKEPEEQ